jgi:peptidoglycan/LPS O-acetylase OafA/YrhL
MTAGHIRGFDGLRAISIILVIITHLGIYHDLPEHHFIRVRMWPLFSGGTGVNIFFTLSGFLITRLLILEKLRTGSIDLKRFYVRRFIRLTPPFILFMVINIVLVLFGFFKITAFGMLVSFFYLYNFIPTTLYNGHLGHTWSLAVEEQFYLFWPLIMNFLSRKIIYYIAFSLIIISAVVLIFISDIEIPGTRTGIKLADAFHGSRLFIPAVGPIMIGSVFALFHERMSILPPKLIWCAPILYLFPLWSPISIIEIAPIIQSFGVGLILIWIVVHPQAPFISVLEWSPLAYIGRISYGIYLYHVIFMGMGRGAGLIPVFPWNVLISILFAVVSYEFMERRILRLKDRFR